MYNTGGAQLKQYLQQLTYQYVQKTIDDTTKLLTNIKTLTPMVAQFTHDNMKKENLVVLSGTIPIYFRAKRYNIPVKIYLSKLHPVQSPVCYVCPTAGMMVKPNHRNVNQSNGRVYIPYLSGWNYQTSSLYDLVNTMSMIFGQDPPVYKKPSQKRAKPRHQPTPSYPNFNPGGGGGAYSPTSNVYTHTPSNYTPQQYVQPAPQHRGVRQNVTPEEKLVAKKAELTSRVKKTMKNLCEKKKKSLETETIDCNNLSQKQNEQKNMMQMLDQRLKQFVAQKSQLEEIKTKSETYISKNSGMMDVDKVIKIQDPLDRQKMELKAACGVYSDTMYSLDRAMGNRVIKIDEWKRYTMKYARKQFMKKALVKKIEMKKKF